MSGLTMSGRIGASRHCVGLEEVWLKTVRIPLSYLAKSEGSGGTAGQAMPRETKRDDELGGV